MAATVMAANSREWSAKPLAQHIDPGCGQLKIPNEVTLNFSRYQSSINRGGLIARYWFERHAALPAEIDIASEFPYRTVPLGSGNLAVIVSQSGENRGHIGFA
jgi:glucosamine--fructose-6-phosphate aminotransferase (isomerizing)